MPLSYASFHITPCPPGLQTGVNGSATTHLPTSELTAGTRGWGFIKQNYSMQNKINTLQKKKQQDILVLFRDKTCSKSRKFDRPRPNHSFFSQSELMRSWLFFAALVMIATGVMHCFPNNLKYKNSLAL